MRKFRKNRRTPSNFQKTNSKGTEQQPIFESLEDNIQFIKDKTGNSDDITIRNIKIGENFNTSIAVIYTEGLIDSPSVQNFILETLMLDSQKTPFNTTNNVNSNSFLTYLEESILTVGSIKYIENYDELFTSLLSGNVIIFVDGYNESLSVGMKGGKDRGVNENTNEPSIRGPKESFSESLRTNTSLVRRKINNPNLWIENKKIGKETKTDVSILFINGIANEKVVEEVRTRLNRIDIDGILDGGYIEELIQDETYTPFPTIFHTERPDVTAAALLEGRVAIMIDGSPHPLLVPGLFVQFFQTADDYYQRADSSTLLRMLRFLGFIIALLGPSLYIALTTFHQEMLPTPLLISLAAQREGVPFPAFIEALMMEVTFEILREAGLRMPRAVGQAVSIVGTLVIGTAAVEAGIVSAAMVIVVAITAISSFVVSSFNLAIAVRMLRFPFMGLAASFGLFGIIIGLIALILHLCSLRSFGVPYMAPFAPYIGADQKDALFRLPHWGLSTRPRLISQKNVKREDTPPPKPKERI
ncbi:spore germination protein [Rossellomorea sp. BNER]|uniref:spore germination protein n=1 Tax=Rossellomorea sp. BNER TaxID=2962031 RepID=UPI003AF2470B|nr:spore germination protein [Rossellomorea sp. BNER]